jgi:dolichol-phosphate mannosyltransferase
MITNTPNLVVALPAYLEAENLSTLLPELHDTLRTLNVPYQILVVDSQAPLDKTPEICRRHDASHLHRLGGDSYSDAIKTAISLANGEWLLIMDADYSHPPKTIIDLWDKRNEADLIIASRYVKGGGTENPFGLILLSKVVNATFSLVLGLPYKDVSNSFRLYKQKDIGSLTLECENFDIVEEILIKLVNIRPTFTALEIPFTFQKRSSGQSKRQLWQFAKSYLKTLSKLRRIKSQDKRIRSND